MKFKSKAAEKEFERRHAEAVNRAGDVHVGSAALRLEEAVGCADIVEAEFARGNTSAGEIGHAVELLQAGVTVEKQLASFESWPVADLWAYSDRFREKIRKAFAAAKDRLEIESEREISANPPVCVSFPSGGKLTEESLEKIQKFVDESGAWSIGWKTDDKLAPGYTILSKGIAGNRIEYFVVDDIVDEPEEGPDPPKIDAELLEVLKERRPDLDWKLHHEWGVEAKIENIPSMDRVRCFVVCDQPMYTVVYEFQGEVAHLHSALPFDRLFAALAEPFRLYDYEPGHPEDPTGMWLPDGEKVGPWFEDDDGIWTRDDTGVAYFAHFDFCPCLNNYWYGLNAEGPSVATDWDKLCSDRDVYRTLQPMQAELEAKYGGKTVEMTVTSTGIDDQCREAIAFFDEQRITGDFEFSLITVDTEEILAHGRLTRTQAATARRYYRAGVWEYSPRKFVHIVEVRDSAKRWSR